MHFVVIISIALNWVLVEFLLVYCCRWICLKNTTGKLWVESTFVVPFQHNFEKYQKMVPVERVVFNLEQKEDNQTTTTGSRAGHKFYLLKDDTILISNNYRKAILEMLSTAIP